MDPSRVVGEVLDDLVCAICRNVVQDPVATSCEHHFCRPCLDSWLGLGHSTCPSCRTRGISKAAPARFYRRTLDRLRIRCLQAPACDVELAQEEMCHHDSECGFAVVACPNGCGEEMQRSEVENHGPDCPDRVAPCALCGEGVVWRRRKAHPRACAAVKLACRSRCGARVPRGEMDAHLADACPRAKVGCPNGDAGCAWHSQRRLLEQHMEECPKAPAECPYCQHGDGMLREDLAAHVDGCDLAVLPCPSGCEAAPMERRLLAAHVNDECPLVMVPCPLDGCDQEAARGELERHVAECPHRRAPCKLCGEEGLVLHMGEHQERVCVGVEVPCPAGCGASVRRKDADFHARFLCEAASVPCPGAAAPAGAVTAPARRSEMLKRVAEAPAEHIVALGDALAVEALDHGNSTRHLSMRVAELEAQLQAAQTQLSSTHEALQQLTKVTNMLVGKRRRRLSDVGDEKQPEAEQDPLMADEFRWLADNSERELLATTMQEVLFVTQQLLSTRFSHLEKITVSVVLVNETYVMALLRALHAGAAPQLRVLVLDGTMMPDSVAPGLCAFVRGGACPRLQALHVVGHMFGAEQVASVQEAMQAARPQCALAVQPSDATYEVSGAGLSYINGLYRYHCEHMHAPMYSMRNTPRGTISLCRYRLNTGRRAWYVSALRLYNAGAPRDSDFYRTVSVSPAVCPPVPPSGNWNGNTTAAPTSAPHPTVLPYVPLPPAEDS